VNCGNTFTTSLTANSVGGLEVFHRDTETWHPVKVVKDAFVVNIGDMLGQYFITIFPLAPLNSLQRNEQTIIIPRHSIESLLPLVTSTVTAWPSSMRAFWTKGLSVFRRA
jgi:hypothetical protein